MSSLTSLATVFVLIFWPTNVVVLTLDVLPSFFCITVFTSALTSAKTNGASYLKRSSPSLMAFTGTGPQQYTPDVGQRSGQDSSFSLNELKRVLLRGVCYRRSFPEASGRWPASH